MTTRDHWLDIVPNFHFYFYFSGIFGVVKQLLHLSARVRQTEEERHEENLRQSPTQTLLNCFMLGWFIIGKYSEITNCNNNVEPQMKMRIYKFLLEWFIVCIIVV